MLNLQGDIIQIVDANGAVVVEYTYDAWGKVLNVTGSMAGTLGKIQPFRYRGYVYDVETGLYYLRSRYYSYEKNRFINNDLTINNNKYGNLFVYCSNSLINKKDLNGQEEISAIENCENKELEFMIILGINPNNLSPNTTYHYKSGNGSDMYIWTDNTGKVIHSRHYTDHGYPNHPNPHDHDWYDKNDGSGNREQGHDPLPPNDDYSEDDAIEYYLKFESREVYVPQYERQENLGYLLVLELLLYAIGVPVPVPVI